jgi:hypothetical protein
MPRQPNSGAGAAVRAPSGAAARAPSPSSSPLPPQRYRALRARYNALLVTLYERSSLTLREIAAVAGRTERAMQIRVRALGCRPRDATKCRAGTTLGVRRGGPRPPRLNAKATQRVLAAFADVARELAASADAQAASEAKRATARAVSRTARAQRRVMASAARQLGHLAKTMEHASAAGETLARKATRSRARKPDAAPKRFSPAQAWLANQRILGEQARIRQAHEEAARQAEAAATSAPTAEEDFERRLDALAARIRPRPRPGPRVRRIW